MHSARELFLQKITVSARNELLIGVLTIPVCDCDRCSIEEAVVLEQRRWSNRAWSVSLADCASVVRYAVVLQKTRGVWPAQC